MYILPAIDLRNNQVVRLSQGDYNQTKIYSSDVAATAQGFAAAGATHLHIVDLDGAKEGKLLSQEAIRTITATPGLFFEIGGGIRDEDRINHYLEMGIDRVILGTVAIQKPEFVAEMVKKYGAHIAVGVDAKNEMVATHGWLEDSGINSFDFCQKMQDFGVSTVIYTDIAKDGMLSGCNLPAYEKLCQLKSLDIIASGGVSSAQEIRALRAMGCAGAIVGKAIYEGKLSLKEALEA